MKKKGKDKDDKKAKEEKKPADPRKIVLITGASRGIGYCLVENLQKKKKSMDNINKKRVKLFKKELTLVENKDKEEVKNNKINGYIRAYNSIKIKFDIDKNIKIFKFLN